jgi:hypothetical protein
MNLDNDKSEKVTWIEDLWFREFVYMLSYTKNFYQKENFNNWVNSVTEQIEYLNNYSNKSWEIEDLANLITYN